jgi:hypothetical protein
LVVLLVLWYIVLRTRLHIGLELKPPLCKRSFALCDSLIGYWLYYRFSGQASSPWALRLFWCYECMSSTRWPLLDLSFWKSYLDFNTRCEVKKENQVMLSSGSLFRIATFLPNDAWDWGPWKSTTSNPQSTHQNPWTTAEICTY